MDANKISFEDCPYNCQGGKIFNQATRSFVACPYCSQKRKEELNNAVIADSSDLGSVEKALNIPKSYWGTSFQFENIFRSKDFRDIFTSQSLTSVKQEADNLINKVTLAELPDYSVAFNFGFRADVFAFIYPFLTKAYISGLKTAPLVTGFTLSKLRLEAQTSFKLDEVSELMEEYQRKDKKWGSRFEDYIDADICVVLLDAAATIADISSVRGLMMHRAIKGKATVVVIDCYIRLVKQLLTDLNTSRSFDTAYFATVHLNKEALKKLFINTEKEGYLAHELSEGDVENLSTLDGFTDMPENHSAVQGGSMTEQQFADLFKSSGDIL